MKCETCLFRKNGHCELKKKQIPPEGNCMQYFERGLKYEDL